MDTQQQRETHQVHAIQNVSGDELKKQTWLQRRRRLIVWLHWNKEKEDEFSPTQHYKYGFSKTLDVRVPEKLSQHWRKKDGALNVASSTY